MPRPKVYVTRKISKSGLNKIKNHFETEVWEGYAPPPKEVVMRKVEDVDAIVSLLSDEIDSEVFDVAPQLRIVSQLAVGFDNINVKEATKRGIYVTNTPGVLTDTAADFAWALLMAVARRVVEADRYVREGKWGVGWHPHMMLGRDVHGATLGIVGAGRVGSAVAKRAKGFNMELLYYNKSAKPDLEQELGAKRVGLDVLLKRSDFVSVHVPLRESTHHLISAEQLKMMKGTSYLINNSRGPVIDERALYQALKECRIAGAALDVFEQEPTPRENPLLKLENVVVAPHLSSASYETRSKMAEMVAENLVAFFEGRKPPNLVNQEVLPVRELPGNL